MCFTYKIHYDFEPIIWTSFLHVECSKDGTDPYFLASLELKTFSKEDDNKAPYMVNIVFNIFFNFIYRIYYWLKEYYDLVFYMKLVLYIFVSNIFCILDFSFPLHEGLRRELGECRQFGNSIFRESYSRGLQALGCTF